MAIGRSKKELATYGYIPLAPPTAAFVTGIVVAEMRPSWAAAVFLLGGTSTLLKLLLAALGCGDRVDHSTSDGCSQSTYHVSAVALLGIWSTLGFAWWWSGNDWASGDSIYAIAPKDPAPCVLEGRVIGIPRQLPESDQPWKQSAIASSVVVSVCSVRREQCWAKVRGRVVIRVDVAPSKIQTGQVYRWRGSLSRIGSRAQKRLLSTIDSSAEFIHDEAKQTVLPMSTHDSRQDRYWRHQRVRVRMSVSSFEPADNQQGSWAERVVGYFQRHLGRSRLAADQRLKESLRPGAFQLTRSLTLGLRDQLDRRERFNFQHSGLSHILAISGLHIGIGFFLIHAPLIRVVRHRAAARWIAISVVVAYAMLVGLRPSVFRAAIFVVVWGGTLTMSRPIGSLAKISVTALIVLILEPRACFDFGAQLSFLGVWMITALNGVPPSDITSWATSKCAGSSSAVVTAVARLIQGFAQGFQSTVNVLLGVLPLIAFQTGTAAWAVLVLNPLAVLLAMILLASGSINFVPGLNQVALPYASPVLEFSAAALQWLAALGQEWFRPIEVGERSLWALIGFYAILVVSMRYIDSRDGRRRVLLILLIANALFLLVPLASSPSSFESDQRRVRLVLVDVGHGSAMVLQWPNRSIWLIDAGSNLGGRYAAKKIGAALERMDTKTVDRLFLSHPDRDHFNAVIPLTSKYNISEVVVPSCFADHPDVQWNRTLKVLRNKGADLHWVVADVFVDGLPGKQEDHVSAGANRTARLPIDSQEARVEVLHPSGDIAGSSDNQRSLVLRIRIGTKTLVVPGDVESESGLDVAKQAGRCDLLVAPHHGSNSSDPLAWIETCDPEIVLVSAGHSWSWIDQYANQAQETTHFISTYRHGSVVLEFDAMDGTLLRQFQIPP